ncbi:hypothetical protein AB1L30_18935 [Bremerella sp. JC817]|uniref:hypothetical protein n=1 Tax=Bremerella sp. JC817 TaxID=3231756 RepID=UPI00345A3B07
MSALKFPLTCLVACLVVGCQKPEEPPKPTPPPIRTESIAPAQTPEPTAKIDPPATVQQDSDRTVRLSPLMAALAGKQLEVDDRDRISGFGTRADQAIWQVHLAVPGTYRVEVDAVCLSPTQEAQMRIHIGERRFVEEKITLSKNDQPVITTQMGEITLDAPADYRVVVEMTGIPLVGEFAMTEMRLVPLEDEPLPLPKFEAGDGSPQK